jgi:very-short-patch-repair endonuclease
LEIYEFVKSLNPHVVSGKRGLLTNRKFELDIYIPSLKKAIEFDGIYWHESKWAKDRGIPERDARKDEECKKAGITLLRIQEEYYASLPDQVRGIIKAFLETQENE